MSGRRGLPARLPSLRPGEGGGGGAARAGAGLWAGGNRGLWGHRGFVGDSAGCWGQRCPGGELGVCVTERRERGVRLRAQLLPFPERKGGEAPGEERAWRGAPLGQVPSHGKGRRGGSGCWFNWSDCTLLTVFQYVPYRCWFRRVFPRVDNVLCLHSLLKRKDFFFFCHCAFCHQNSRGI